MGHSQAQTNVTKARHGGGSPVSPTDWFPGVTREGVSLQLGLLQVLSVYVRMCIWQCSAVTETGVSGGAGEIWCKSLRNLIK
jgi:hypothetical protein